MNIHIGLHKFEDVNGNSSMTVKWLNAHRMEGTPKTFVLTTYFELDGTNEV